MGKKKESKLVKYLLIGISILFLFVYAGASFDCSCNGGIEKRMAGLCGSGDRFFYDAALMLTLKATVIAVLCNTVLGLCAAGQ